MRSIQFLLLIFLVLVPSCIGGPLERGTYDNRLDDRVEITAVTSDCVFELSDGRRVRLFGVEPIDKARDDWFRKFSTYVGGEATVEIGLPVPADLPAVEITVFENMGLGHTGSWDPWASPLGNWAGIPLATNMASGQQAVIREIDLRHKDANPRLVQAIRESREYGLRYRAGLAP